MNTISTALDKINTIIEEVISSNIDIEREELRDELRREFQEANRELIERIEKLETILSMNSEERQEANRGLIQRIEKLETLLPMNSEEEVKMTENKRKKKRIKKLTNFYIIQDSYTPDEVATMNSFILCSEFSRLTLNNKTTMYCNHCKKDTPFKNWVNSIRSRCMKKQGLSANTQIPKTCDRQQAVNSIANTINNRVYPKLRNEKLDESQKRIWIQWRELMFKKLGMKIMPYKYIF